MYIYVELSWISCEVTHIRSAIVSLCKPLLLRAAPLVQLQSDAVHLVEERGQHALLHVASASARTRASADDRVDLVDEEDGGRT